MKKTLVAILALSVCLMGCIPTSPINGPINSGMVYTPEDTPKNEAPIDIDIDHCKKNDIDCIVEAVDAVAQEQYHPDKMYVHMDGYQPSSARELLDLKVLEIKLMNPLIQVGGLVAGTLILGATATKPGMYGDTAGATCYIPFWLPGSNAIIKHEIQHAVGYWGGYHHGARGYFSQHQIDIMREDGVERWTETERYKNEDDKYHLTPAQLVIYNDAKPVYPQLSKKEVGAKWDKYDDMMKEEQK